MKRRQRKIYQFRCPEACVGGETFVNGRSLAYLGRRPVTSGPRCSANRCQNHLMTMAVASGLAAQFFPKQPDFPSDRKPSARVEHGRSLFNEINDKVSEVGQCQDERKINQNQPPEETTASSALTT